MRFGRGLAVAFVIVLMTIGVAHPDELASPSANTLYDAAYDRWAALAVAPFATYGGRFTLVRGGKTQVRLFEVAYRSSDRRCRVSGRALDARDRPDPPRVTDRCLPPDFSFTFVPQASNGTDATGLSLNVPTPDPSESNDLRTITTVRARSRPYEIAIAGSETIEGTSAVHLTLRPYRDPDKHILRDLWVDPATYGVVRLRGEATSGPNLFHVDFTATYAENAGSQTLTRIDAFAKAQLLFVRASGDVTYVLTNVTYPASLADELFAGPIKH